MSISSVTTRTGTALAPHTGKFIGSEFTVRRNELWAQGSSQVSDDEIIEGLVDDLFDDINAILNRNSNDDMAR